VRSSEKKVFGEPLLSHLQTCGKKIALPIEECVSMLLRTGLREEVSTHRRVIQVQLCTYTQRIAHPHHCMPSIISRCFAFRLTPSLFLTTYFSDCHLGVVQTSSCCICYEKTEKLSGFRDSRPKWVQLWPTCCGR